MVVQTHVEQEHPKHVAVFDKDEKAGTIVMVTSTAAGKLLGFQMLADRSSHQVLNRFFLWAH